MQQRERRDFAIIYAGAFIALLMSKGLALVPALGLDDYVALHQDRDFVFYLWQGRFTQALIQIVLTKLGVSPTAIAWPVIVLFFGFAACAITLGILYVANNKGAALGLSAVGAVIGSHPYLTEYFTFRESLITQGASFALIALVFFVSNHDLAGPRPIRLIRSIFLLFTMILLAGAQQTAFLILGFFIISAVVQQALNGDLFKEDPECRRRRELLILYFIAALFYVFIYVIIGRLTNVPADSRGSIVSLGALGGRIDLVAALTGKILLSGEPTLSLGAKWYLYSVFLFFLLLDGVYRPSSLLPIAVTSALLYAGSIFLVSVSGIWWPVPRAVYAFGFAVGISLLLVYINAQRRAARVFPIAVFVAAVGLAFHSSAILYDQIRLNRWDAWVAGAVARDLAKIDAGMQTKVILVGAGWRHPVGLASIDGDLNTSALAVPWAANHLFMEVTGKKWNVESIAKSPECENVAPWPKADAIKQVNNSVYVCL